MRPELHRALAAAALPAETKQALAAALEARDVKGLPADQYLDAITATITEAEQAHAAWLKSPRHLALQALEAAFFGALGPREAGGGVERPRRAPNGWRHGVSHPFTLGAETFDVHVADVRGLTAPQAARARGEASDRTVAQYEQLRARIQAELPAT